MIDIRKGDTLVLFNGERVTAAGKPVDITDLIPHWIVTVETDDGMRLPVNLDAIVGIERDGAVVSQQLTLWGEEDA